MDGGEPESFPLTELRILELILDCRQLYLTNTFKNNNNFLNHVYTMFKTVSPALSTIVNSGLSLTVQPIPPATIAASKGRNSLGLDPADGALVCNS